MTIIYRPLEVILSAPTSPFIVFLGCPSNNLKPDKNMSGSSQRLVDGLDREQDLGRAHYLLIASTRGRQTELFSRVTFLNIECPFVLHKYLVSVPSRRTLVVRPVCCVTQIHQTKEARMIECGWRGGRGLGWGWAEASSCSSCAQPRVTDLGHGPAPGGLFTVYWPQSYAHHTVSQQISPAF